MPRNLITGFKKVATAGPTVDGRKIEEQDLLDIAETYNEKDQYAAVIWPEHLRWFNMGVVKEVKAERDSQGRMSLYARIAPNDHALRYNKESQLLYSSIEITPNFANTGKAYLTGMALTDSPASLGTQEMRFNKKEKDSFLAFSTDPLGDLDEVHNPDSNDDQAAKEGILKTLAAFFKNNPPDTGSTPESEEDSDEMNTEQFNQLTDTLKAQTEAIGAMGEAFGSLATKLGGNAGGEGAQGEETPPEGESNVPGDDSEEHFSKVLESIESLTNQVGELTKQFNQALEENPGTTVPEGNGANESQEMVC